MKKPGKKDVRNLHAVAPIMRKGGVHQKSESAERTAARRQLKQQLSSSKGAQHIGREGSADADQLLVA